MKDDPDKDFVLLLLGNMGFHAEPIPEASHKTPDLKIKLHEGDIIVEVKSKEDDKQFRDLLESPPGTSLSYNISSAASALHDAWRQIHDFPERDKEDFTLIWFITRKVGGVTVLTTRHIKTYLYGIEIISGRKADRKVFNLIDCYFFNESFFFKYKNLDGVVLQDAQLVELCLNPCSPHYKTFKSMKLAEVFRDHSSVIDPREMEARGKCFFADCDISRKDKDGIVRYLQSKYGLDIVTIEPLIYINLPA